MRIAALPLAVVVAFAAACSKTEEAPPPAGPAGAAGAPAATAPTATPGDVQPFVPQKMMVQKDVPIEGSIEKQEGGFRIVGKGTSPLPSNAEQDERVRVAAATAGLVARRSALKKLEEALGKPIDPQTFPKLMNAMKVVEQNEGLAGVSVSVELLVDAGGQPRSAASPSR